MDSAEAFPEYTKINTVWKRTERGEIVVDDYATPELEYLRDAPFSWTEKIDGTNIRIAWDGSAQRIGGRTAQAQIPVRLLDALNEIVTDEALTGTFTDEAASVVLFGEGYGAGIQSGGVYRADPSFILFDVLIGSWWLRRDDVADVAQKLGIEVVAEVLPPCAMRVAAKAIRDGVVPSVFPAAPIEGLVGRPLVDLFDRKGKRIMAKIKAKDYKRVAE